jgi:hypothetical protein
LGLPVPERRKTENPDCCADHRQRAPPSWKRRRERDCHRAGERRDSGSDVQGHDERLQAISGNGIAQ